MLPSGGDLDVAELDDVRKRFFGAAPRDVLQANADAMRGIAAADATGAVLVVLPELSVDTTGAEGLAAWVSREATSIGFAVCGTHHVETSGARRNEAIIASAFAPTLRQSKVVGMDWRPPDRDGKYREDVETSPTDLLLISSTTWSSLVLICRDFIDTRLSSLAAALRTWGWTVDGNRHDG